MFWQGTVATVAGRGLALENIRGEIKFNNVRWYCFIFEVWSCSF